MVTDDLAEEDFVRCDLFALSQLELDGSGGAKRIAVTFAVRVRISGCYAHAIGLGIIGATRGC